MFRRRAAPARYCELLFEAGDHEAAIACAPAVSKDFWRQLLGKYTQLLERPARGAFLGRIMVYYMMVHHLMVRYMIWCTNGI